MNRKGKLHFFPCITVIYCQGVSFCILPIFVSFCFSCCKLCSLQETIFFTPGSSLLFFYGRGNFSSLFFLQLFRGQCLLQLFHTLCTALFCRLLALLAFQFLFQLSLRSSVLKTLLSALYQGNNTIHNAI